MKKRKNTVQPLPWRHITRGKTMSAVVDAEGQVVCGSLIYPQPNPEINRNTHAYIIKAVNTYSDLLAKRDRKVTIEDTVCKKCDLKDKCSYSGDPWCINDCIMQ